MGAEEKPFFARRARNQFYLMSFALLLVLLLTREAASGPADERSAEATKLRPLRNELPFGVIKVRKEGEPGDSKATCLAGRNDSICVQVQDLGVWLTEVQTKEGDPRPRDTEHLILYLGGEPMLGLHPERLDEWRTQDTNHIISNLRFTLERNDANKPAWKKLLRCPTFERPLEVSVGFEAGPRIQSWVIPMPKPTESKFFLLVIPKAQLIAGLIIIVGALITFIVLARTTGIIRDPNLPVRLDGDRPLSLARAQMAFWFFLVIGSYFFLWLLTGDTDTINSSIVTLIGISAATAVSSALIDSSRDREPKTDEELAPAHLKGKRREILTHLRSNLRDLDKQLENLRNSRPGIPEDKVADLLKAQEELAERKSVLERQHSFFRQPLWKLAMHDLLSERGVITFHKFQMCVWTLVLGIIFVITVYSDVAMPEFSGTLLSLMGVSAGTFIGFKLPQENRNSGNPDSEVRNPK